MTVESERRHYPVLDLLRVVAISMTILVHTPSIAGRLPVLREVQWGLNLGVDLFMLISGWLLGGQLLRKAYSPERGILRFYIRRWMRTLPPYYVMLLVLWLSGTSFAPENNWRTLLSHFVFAQEYLKDGRYGVAWSLCVEEHFYLVLPLLVPILIRFGNAKRAIGVMVAISLLQLACRQIQFQWPTYLPIQSHVRSEGLFMGLLLAYFSQYAPAIWFRLGRTSVWCFGLGIALTVATMCLSRLAPSLAFFMLLPTLGTWSLALFFVATVHEQSPLSNLHLPGARYMGELTYSVYLVHALVPQLLQRYLPNLHQTKLGVLGAVLLLSLILHHSVERPALRLRDKIIARGTPTSSAVDVPTLSN